MVDYAFAVPVRREYIEDWRKAASELEGERHAAHRDLLARSGIWLERSWLQTQADGSAVTLWFYTCDDLRDAFTWSQNGTPHDEWFRSQVLGTYHGLSSARAPASFNAQWVDIELDGSAIGSYAFAVPVAPSQLEDWKAFCAAINGGSRARVHRDFLAEAHIRRERVFLQQPSDIDESPLAIFCWDCDDAHTPFEVISAGRSEHARYIRDVVAGQMHGVDFTTAPPPLNELLYVTHVRRSDAQEHPNATVVRRCYAALAARDTEALREMIAPDCVLEFAGRSPIAGTYIGRNAVMKRLALPAQLTAGTFRTEVRDVFWNDTGAVALAHSTASREGQTLDVDMCAVFWISGGRIQRLRFTALSDQYTLDDFWS